MPILLYFVEQFSYEKWKILHKHVHYSTEQGELDNLWKYFSS